MNGARPRAFVVSRPQSRLFEWARGAALLNGLGQCSLRVGAWPPFLKQDEATCTSCDPCVEEISHSAAFWAGACVFVAPDSSAPQCRAFSACFLAFYRAAPLPTRRVVIQVGSEFAAQSSAPGDAPPACGKTRGSLPSPHKLLPPGINTSATESRTGNMRAE